MIQIITREGVQRVWQHSQSRLSRIPMTEWPNVATHVKADQMAFPRQRGRFSLKFVLSGSETYRFTDRSVRVNPINFLPIHQGHGYASAIEAADQVEAVCLFFDQNMLARSMRPGLFSEKQLQRHLDHLSPPECLLPLNETLFAQVRGLVDQPPKGEGFDRGMRDILTRALTQSSREWSNWDYVHSARDTTREDIVRRILRGKDFLDSHLREAVRVHQAAREAFLSKFHFIRCFRSVMGLSPMAYLRRERLRLARYLLRSTRKSILEIAQETGYENASAFSRVFARYCHKPPRVYRAMLSDRLAQ